jgi:phosphoserine phosphatase
MTLRKTDLAIHRRAAVALVGALWLACGPAQAQSQAQTDPLATWAAGPAKARIVAFVQAVTEPGGKDFVVPADRIAVFDNDGTLWSEQPMYFQLAFAMDRVRALAPKRPEWKTKQPFKAALEGDMKTLAAAGEHGLLELVAASHAGLSTDEFAAVVKDWLATARHPRFKRPYTELTFAPMVELLAYLRANGFQTWIVSGGGVKFMRVFGEQAYGIPPQQMVGSSLALKYELRNGQPALVQQAKVAFIDDKAGKPVGLHKAIGKRPIAAFGNSDGDFEMLEWTTSAPGARLGVMVHHDDAAREYAYDRTSPFGKLARGLDEAGPRGWTLVSMKTDWLRVYAP